MNIQGWAWMIYHLVVARETEDVGMLSVTVHHLYLLFEQQTLSLSRWGCSLSSCSQYSEFK